MKTVTVRELRNQFAWVAKCLERGDSVQILRRGKPFARLIAETQTTSLLGRMRGTAELPRDLDEPTGVSWEASR